MTINKTFLAMVSLAIATATPASITWAKVDQAQADKLGVQNSRLPVQKWPVTQRVPFLRTMAE